MPLSRRWITQQLYSNIVTALLDLTGGGAVVLPSSVADLVSREVAPLADRTQRSPARSPLERVKFFKLVWDAIGSEFGSRHN